MAAVMLITLIGLLALILASFPNGDSGRTPANSLRFANPFAKRSYY
jgi:hypothetical protein